ncbi:L-rhamnose/proton symporter RhaT [Parapedobacter indicus]|uniref:L-rhamnose-H+ transport protein n=1 Tax=Parapedobacter indicus TaxID=1477437 RepID=A0A1I3S130_9SPHI|nr:L-rhamnose/proton symporter RhaT [Parapedobacter indicus]PPK99919.1 L-rhamnose-H+ transport protein [Parapedobacter indicus]SFJ51842.1 L-rhamnose-H+ transport protein [Parapedobacter indicus]
MNLTEGILLHAVGAFSAALCYTPQKKTVSWSWQTFWLAQAAVCWLLLPIVVAVLTIPELLTVLREAPADAMGKSFALGALYGVGGTAFGLAIRYVGFSLTYAVSVGLSCVLGTLLPPLYHGTLMTTLAEAGGAWIGWGVVVGTAGIAFCGLAGVAKEKDLIRGNNLFQFDVRKGLPLCILAGVLSACYSFALDQGQPIAEVAERHGAGSFQGNVIYLFSNTGAFLVTCLYCVHLHRKHRSFAEYRLLTTAEPSNRRRLGWNYLLACLTGCMWYTQFFFYGLGHVRMGNYKFSSWAIHMIMLVAISLIIGLLMKEWSGVRRPTLVALYVALLTLVASVLLLTYGNYLGTV